MKPDHTDNLPFLYELSLSVGSSLDLKENCHQFLTTITRRKEIDSASVWIKSALLPGTETETGYAMICAIPEKKASVKTIPFDHRIVQLLKDNKVISYSDKEKEFRDIIIEKGVFKGVSIIYTLGEIGFLKLHSSAKQGSPDFIKPEILLDVISSFTNSLNGCLAYQASIIESGNLRESEAKFKSIIDKANDGIYIRSKEGILEFVNDKFLEIHGYERDEVIGKKSWTLLDPDDLEENTPPGKSFSDIGDGFHGESRIKTKAGEQKYIDINTVPIITSEGEQKVFGIIRDITGRKKTESVLLEAENKWRSLLENSPDIILALDADRKILFANRVNPELTLEQVIGSSVFDYLPPEHHDMYQQNFDVAFRTGKQITIELQAMDRWYISRFVPLQKEGKTTSVMVIATDITERRQITEKLEEAVETLKNNEQYLQSINKFATHILKHNTVDAIAWELTHMVIKELGFVDCIIYLLDENKELLVQTAAYGPKQSPQNIIKDPIVIPVGKGIVGTVAKTGISELIHDTSKDPRYILDDELRMSELAVPIVADNEIIGVIDTEHPEKEFYTETHLERLQTVSGLVSVRIKNAINQEKLEVVQQSLIKLSAAIEQSSLSVVITDPNGFIEFVNPTFEEVTGYKSDEVIGRKTNILNSGKHPVSLYAELWKTVLSGRKWIGELTNKKKNGDLYWVLISISPITNNQGEITNFVAMHTDITQLKQLESDLIKAKEKAIEADKAKSIFLATMSHEIRNPMNAIIGVANYLSEQDFTLEQQKYLNNLSISADNLLHIIDSILDFSKVEAGELHLEMAPFNLKMIIESLISSARIMAENKSLALSSIVDNEIDQEIIGDKVRLNQILLNLLSNAIKFTSEGGIMLACKRVEMDSDKMKIAFSVRDTGVGIPKKNQQLIFESFKQGDKMSLSKQKGTGLGLAICKRLVHLMGGDIAVQSKKGHGSTFSFTLEFDIGKKLIDIDEQDRKVSTNTDVKGIRILMVEDDQFNLEIGEQILITADAFVDTAQNGSEAINLIKKNDYDIILMDLRMPVLGGIEATKIIRNELKKTTPIIALTAEVLKGTIEVCMSAGMNDYVSKPFVKEELLQKITKIISEEQTTGLKKNIRNMRCLLVDDDRIIHAVAKNILLSFGCETELAINGIDALNKMKEISYDFVLMNLDMPEMSGIQATKLIRKRFDKNIIIIAHSNDDRQEVIRKCMEVGMNGFIKKTSNPNFLLQSILDILNRTT